MDRSRLHGHIPVRSYQAREKARSWAEIAAPDISADQPRCGLDDNYREVAVLNVVYLCSVYNWQGNASRAYGNTEAGGPTALSILTQSHRFRRPRDVLGFRCY